VRARRRPHPDESTIETPEPLLAEITKSLVGKPLEELMGDEDLVSRRPYLCSRCAGPSPSTSTGLSGMLPGTDSIQGQVGSSLTRSPQAPSPRSL